MRFLLKASDESARPRQHPVEVIDAEKQKQPVAGLRVIRTHQGGMLMGAPLVKTEQDRSVRVDDLTEIVVG
ncbi:MAG TPA: hypothetical protein VF420_16945 [Casimicrobiaceae bacterium]